jgi:serine/threonine-protein kinase
MEAAHANHIIHRDIKPQNIIISKEGKVKVTDFGIAKAASSNTINSNAMGSVHYISPEQARGGYSDEKSDIYSLGVTIYEMLSGKVPFNGDSTVSVALAHIQEDAIPLRTLNPEIPVSLDRIVQKCMQKKPERRYLSALALIEDLKQSLVNPTGDFVQLVPSLIDDSPTINLSESELNTIKKSMRHPVSTEGYGQKQEEESLAALEKEEAEDTEAEIDPKAEKLLVGGGIAAAVILFLLIVFMIGKFFGLFGGGGKVEPEGSATPAVTTETPGTEEENKMPKVIGLTKEQALAALSELGITPEIEEGASELYGEDIVCDQSPAQGEALEENMIVKITISTGSESISVPNVVNLSREAAEAELVKAGFTVGGTEEQYSDTVDAGKVCATSPSAGASASKGSVIKLYISKGKETKTATVPDLYNLTEADALKKLEDAGLKGSVSKTQESDTVEKGRVISQSHSQGTQVDVDTTITFVISSGPAETYKYYGSVTITDNPFDYEDEEGTITLVLSQDGKSKEVYRETQDYDSFPLRVTDIEGTSDSMGEITMYLDGEKVSTYSISFEKVRQ